MPDPDLVCEVRTEGGKYRNWLTVQVSQAIDSGFQRTFRLTSAEPSTDRDKRLIIGSRVDIALAGEVVIERGFIGDTERGFDANRHAVLLSGASKAELALHGSAKAGQFRGYTIDAVANAALKPLGLKFRLENPSEEAKRPFPNVRVHTGETPFEFIKRLCWMRGLWMRAEPNGDLVAGSKQGGGGIVFEEGVNILSANCARSWTGLGTAIATGQQPGSDSLFGRKAAEVSGQVQIQGGQPGAEHRIIVEMPASQRDAETRAGMEVQAIQAGLLRVTLSYPGWLNPAGRLWDLTDFVTVKSKSLFPEVESGELALQMWGYTYAQTPDGQTTTAIDLVNPAAFRLRIPDGQANSGLYEQPASPPQAEPET